MFFYISFAVSIDDCIMGLCNWFYISFIEPAIDDYFFRFILFRFLFLFLFYLIRFSFSWNCIRTLSFYFAYAIDLCLFCFVFSSVFYFSFQMHFMGILKWSDWK